jgi:hypothetical protein
MDATGTEKQVCADLGYRHSQHPALRDVCDDLAARQQVGIKKYGVTVAENPLTLKQWLRHAYEEALDLMVYLRRAYDEAPDDGTGVDNYMLRLNLKTMYERAMEAALYLRKLLKEIK